MDSALVSFVIPCHNEESALPELFRNLQDFFEAERRVRFEVVFVDDGSGDATPALVRLAADSDPRFRLVQLSRNFGKEAALTAGIRAAKGDAVVPMDADGQDPVDLVTRFVDHWLQGVLVVVGRRSDRSTDTWAKRTLARGFYSIFNRLSPMPLLADVGDFRLMDRKVVDAFLELPERNRFLKGLFAYTGFSAEIVDYARPVRAAGRTKFSTWKLWNFALDGLLSFSTAPLRIWTYMGALTALLTVVYATVIFVLAVTGDVSVPGYASTLIAVLFTGAMNLVGLGVVGEYLGRVYSETKARPLYFVVSSYPDDREGAERG